MYEGLNFILYKMSLVRGLNFLHFPLLHHTYILSFKVILFFRWRGIFLISDAIVLLLLLAHIHLICLKEQ